MIIVRDTESAIKRFLLTHGDRYDYSKVEYVNAITPVKIVCEEHGEFLQLCYSHYAGTGCPTCGREKADLARRIGIEEFIRRSKEIHGDKYDYSESVYKGNDKKLKVGCPIHGKFLIRPAEHFNGQGCRTCGIAKRVKASAMTLDQFKSRAKEIHNGKYNYESITEIKNSKAKVVILCPEHGFFSQEIASHLQGHGCDKCAKVRSSKALSSDSNTFIKKAKKVHSKKYDYSRVKYINCKNKVEIICTTCGYHFTQTPGDHLQGYGCPKCPNHISKPETDIADFIAHYFEIERGNRRILGRRELDIYIPEKQIAIEYNGSYYHSDKHHKDPIWHLLRKQQDCEKLGIRLIHVSDYEDITIVKKTLAHILGINDESYYARKCTTSIHSSQEPDIVDFFHRNHLQGTVNGCWVGCLRMKGQIVCVMAFSKATSERGNTDKSRWELRRFASVCRVVGGASRLLKLFVKTHLECSSIISYSENRWFTGGMYEKLGFSHTKTSKPDYKYTKQGKIEPKGRFKRSCLHRRHDIDFRPEESESENCKRNGWHKIWDCGKRKWELILDK